MVETQSLKRSRMPSLGTDPCQEILTRLPVKSLLRFRCVSKTWRALIDDRRFARAHFALAIEKRPESRMYLLEREGEVTECVVRCSETFEPVTSHGHLHTDTFKKQLPGRRRPTRANDIEWLDVGAIDGLFMLVAKRPSGWSSWDCRYNDFNKDRLMLWNPSIKRVRVFPPPPKSRRDEANIVDIGLGFDPSIEDYKHVRFILTGDDIRRVLHWVLVYTLGTNLWKANTFDQDKRYPSRRWSCSFSQPKTVCFRGLMYILAVRKPVHPNKLPHTFDLVLYDLSNEEFTSSNLPTDLKGSYGSCDLRLAKGGSSLALVYLPPSREGSIWLAHGVGADLTWSKHFTLAPPNHHVSSYFLYLDKNGEEMISLLGTHMVTSYNLKTHEEKVVEKKNARLPNLRVCPYVESLMLLN